MCSVETQLQSRKFYWVKKKALKNKIKRERSKT